MSKEQWGAIRSFVEKVIVPTGAVLVVFAAFFGAITYIIRAEVADIKGDVGTMKENLKTLSDDSVRTNQRIDGLLKDALDRAFPRTVSNKSDVHSSLEQAKGIFRLARDENIKLEPQGIQRFGLDVLELVNSSRPNISQHDWQSVNNILSYYSIVNQVDPKFLADMKKYSWGYRLTDRSKDCLEVPPARAGTTPHIVFRDVTVENCTLHLSNAMEQAVMFQNAVFRDVSVIYEGGHVVLDRVAFINCTFQLPLTNTGKRFGETLLAENLIQHLELR